MFIHGRIVWAALIAAALCAFAPATSLASKRGHYLEMYKVEQQVDLGSDSEDVSISCRGTDYVTDGMWRLDHVDQDADYGTLADLMTTGVQVTASHIVSGDRSTWTVHFIKNAAGDAQAKVWVTCLPSKTSQVDGHTVGWVVNGNPGFTFMPGATSTFDTTLGGSGCPASGFQRAIVIAPGFEDTSPDPSARLTGSRPFVSLKDWSWKIASPSSTVRYSWECLELYSTTASSGPAHKHKIVPKWSDNLASPSLDVLPANTQTEVQEHCTQHSKGMVGGFWQTESVYTWFLGMDPRPKTRAYQFFNTDPTNTHTVNVGNVCFNDRTT
jgi:hypothetical protein